MISRTATLIYIFFLSHLNVSFAQPTLNVSCHDASLREVLRAIAGQHGVSLAGLGAVTGNVTIHLDDVPLSDGLRALLEPLGFTYENRNNIYFIRREEADAQRVKLTVTAGKLTIDANNADVKQVIRLLNAEAGVSIVATPNLVGTITGHLTEIPIEDAIPALFASDNFILNQINGIYQVDSTQGADTPGLTIFLNNGLVSIHAQEIPLNELLSELAERAKINVASVGSTSKMTSQDKVTLHLQDKPLEEALADIAKMTTNFYRKSGDLHFIGKGTILPGENNPLLERKVIWLKHLDARDIISLIPADIPKQNITISPERNAVIILGTPDVIESAERVIAELDIDNAQIRTRQDSAVWVDVNNETKTLTVDVKNAPIGRVVRELSLQTGIDVLIMGETGESPAPFVMPRRTEQRRSRRPSSPTIQQRQDRPPQPQASQLVSRRLSQAKLHDKVTLRMADATLEQVFTALFKGIGYTYKREQQLYIVGKGEPIYGTNNPLIVSKLIALNYLDVTKVMELLPTTVPEGNITIIPDQNALRIMGAAEMVEELTAYLAELDVPTPQVMIQVYLLELTHGSGSELGITLDGGKNRTTINLAGGLGLSFDTLDRVPESFGATLSALVVENRGRVLANPLVTVVSGETANINVGVRAFFETTTEIYRGVDVPVGGYSRQGFNTIDTGIELEITPWIGAGGEVTMAIKPEVSIGDIAREQSTLARRSVDTVVRVKDQGMIIIGGLLQEEEVVTENKVPVLGHIPLLGGLLFTSRNSSSEQTELIVIIQPKIIR